jgi:transposase
MAKITTSAKFKRYDQKQPVLLPLNLDDMISSTHLVRVVNKVVDAMDLRALTGQYKGGGTTAYSPVMLLKVLLYGYSIKIYTGRKLAAALRQDVHFMWLAAANYPDFRTINNFRSGKAKDVIELIFKELLEFLMEHKYIKMENYFCDGSTFTADANKHKMVWKKNAVRYKEAAEQKCVELFKQIDELNAAEEKEYGQSNLEVSGEQTTVTAKDIDERVQTLNKKMQEATDKKTVRTCKSLKKKLEDKQVKIQGYERQEATAGKRSGYNKTDKDATAMRMKNKVETLPAYNVLAGSEEQFITGLTVHQNTNDGICFAAHIEEVTTLQQPFKPVNVIADAAFGTEQNYELMETKEINGYLKFPTFHKEQTKGYQNNKFLKDNFAYDALTDTYTCPNKQLLVFTGTHKRTHKITGYTSRVKEYECTSCKGCPFYEQCCKSTKEANRIIRVNEKLDNYKQQAREKLKSDKGVQLRKQRSTEIETCFGDIKHNMGFRRLHVRGIKKVKAELIFAAMAHNIRKINIQTLKTAV